MSTITKSMAPVDYGYLITAEVSIEQVESMIDEHKAELRSYTGKIAFDLTPHAAFLQANLRNGALDSNSICNRESLEAEWHPGDIAYYYDELEDSRWLSTFENEDGNEDIFTDDDYVDNGIVEVQIDFIDYERPFHKIEAESPDTGRGYSMDSINLAPTREAAEALLIPTEQQMAERKEWLHQQSVEITERQNKMASEQYEKDDVPNMTNKFLLYDLETGYFIDEEFESKSGNNIQHAAIFSKESVLDNIDYDMSDVPWSEEDYEQGGIAYAKYMSLKYLQIPLTQDIVTALPFPLTDTDLAKPHSTTYDATKDLKSNYILLTTHDLEPSRSNLYDLGQLDDRNMAKLLLNTEQGVHTDSDVLNDLNVEKTNDTNRDIFIPEMMQPIIIPVSEEQRAKLEQLPAFSKDHEVEAFASSIAALSELLTEEEQII